MKQEAVQLNAYQFHRGAYRLPNHDYLLTRGSFNIKSLLHHPILQPCPLLLFIVRKFLLHRFPFHVFSTLPPFLLFFSPFYSLKSLPTPLSTGFSTPTFPFILCALTSPKTPHTRTQPTHNQCALPTLPNLTHSLLPYLTFLNQGVFGGFEADPLMCGAFQGAHLAIPAFVTALCCTTAYILLPPKLTTGTYFSYFLSCILRRRLKGDAFTDSNNDLNGTCVVKFLHSYCHTPYYKY